MSSNNESKPASQRQSMYERFIIAEREHNLPVPDPTSSFSVLKNRLWNLLWSQNDPLALHSRLVDLIQKVTEAGIITNIIISWIQMVLCNNPHNHDIQRTGREYLQQSVDILTTLKNIIETIHRFLFGITANLLNRPDIPSPTSSTSTTSQPDS